MAVIRTVLPRKGIIQPRHGDNYEADLDANWLLIDSLLQDAEDVQAAVTAAGTVEAWLTDRGLCGILSGLDLGGSTDLTPALSAGVLYAQGIRYAPQTPDPGPAPASSTSYLWYNSTTGFYYNFSGTPVTAGDAFLGSVVTDATRVITVTPAAKMYGQISVTAAAAGEFSLAHNLGRAPLGALIYMTSGGVLWFQSPTMYDTTNLYLVASDAGVTAKVQIW
jgi:hypothetical protein